jgi:rifampicin phosphotransferase
MIDDDRAAAILIRRSTDFGKNGVRPSVAELGGKGRSLAELSVGFQVPKWFSLTPAAFDASLSPQLREALAAGGAPAGLLASVAPSADVLKQLREALAELCPDGGLVAVRSSAADEDGAQSSFAGQLESYLFVTPELVANRVADVWRSAFGQRVMAYRRERGLSGAGSAPAVIVQRMIDADVSGVAFSADPVSGRRDLAVVGALYGLGTALVSGECDADTFHVDGQGRITERQIAEKRFAHRAAPGSGEGVAPVAVPDNLASRPALDDDQVRAVSSLARRAALHLHAPQDIEWAMSGATLYLLQSRPITTLAADSRHEAGSTPSDLSAGGVLNIWDNSNIAESYGGVTTPLTFSFARHAYDGAYRQFCRLMRIPEAAIAAHDDTFRHMLGLIQGRVYYNLLNWYRVLALLPGYRLNRRFMEQMMGVKEPLPDGALAPREATTPERAREWLNVMDVMLAFTGHYFTLRRRCERFFAWLRETLGERRPDYAASSPDELVAEYRRLEQRLISRWDAPLINDLFAMIFFGTLRALCAKWCGDTRGTLQNGLVSGEGGMVSAEPAKLVSQMAGVAARHPSLVAALTDAPLQVALAAIQGAPALAVLFRDYLDRFGDRTTDELKLESPTLRDDPLMLVRSVGRLAEQVARSPAGGEQHTVTEPRVAAERQAAAALQGHPLRGLVFAWVLRNARERIVARENLRFERTRLFGRVRSIFAEMGRKFAAAGILADARDIFYLEVEEALGYVEGIATCSDLASLAALRKMEFDRYRLQPAPPDRFETRGLVSRSAPAQATAALDTGDERRTGLGCCPGVVRGRARVVTDPRNATLRVGEILVAERTDPGWVMLFPAAAGLLVERGSLLSHSAIVAREMRIPAVVALRGVTAWLKDGDWVELDGGAGTVVKINAPDEATGVRA